MADCPHTNTVFYRTEELAYDCEYNAETETLRVKYNSKAEYIDTLSESLFCVDCGEFLHYTEVGG